MTKDDLIKTLKDDLEVQKGIFAFKTMGNCNLIYYRR